MLDVIKNRRFDQESAEWRSRGNRMGIENASGCTAAGADFIYYDPWHHCKITHERAKYLLKHSRVQPAEYPEYYDYDSPITSLEDWGAQSDDDETGQ